MCAGKWIVKIIYSDGNKIALFLYPTVITWYGVITKVSRL